MTRILLCGCNGKMGRVIAACVKEREDCKIVAGIDIHTDPFGDFPVYASPSEVQEEADVVIDFSHPALLSPLLQFGLEHKLPLVLCTTGYNHDQVNALKQASHKIPVFYSGNMSLGINLLIGLSKKAAQVLGEDFDIEIIEKHHNQKIDAPSGTALMIADAISSVEDRQMTYMYDRHSQRKKRDPNEIGIHSVRGGTIVGEHEVIFAGTDEVIEFKHTAYSRGVFAKGAVEAGKFLAGKEAGMYDMGDVIGL